MEQMTPEQAISIIRTNSCYECSFGCDSPLNCDSTKCDLIKAVKLAISALEKQVPKKPELTETKKHNGFGFYIAHDQICPVCKKKFGVVKVGHCSCGQAIDWSE